MAPSARRSGGGAQEPAQTRTTRSAASLVTEPKVEAKSARQKQSVPSSIPSSSAPKVRKLQGSKQAKKSQNADPGASTRSNPIKVATTDGKLHDKPARRGRSAGLQLKEESRSAGDETSRKQGSKHAPTAPTASSKRKRTTNPEEEEEEKSTRKPVTSKKPAVADNSDVTEDEADAIQSKYWLMKAEPESRVENGVDVKFSIDDLKAAKSPEPWDGVRNHAARNHMMAMKNGNLAFFYHSNCKEPGIAGIMEIANESTIDDTAFDKSHPYHDSKSTREKPTWYKVNVSFKRKFDKVITRKELQSFAKPGGILANMQLFKQSRLSVSPVTPQEWDFINKIAAAEVASAEVASEACEVGKDNEGDTSKLDARVARKGTREPSATLEILNSGRKSLTPAKSPAPNGFLPEITEGKKRSRATVSPYTRESPHKKSTKKTTPASHLSVAERPLPSAESGPAGMVSPTPIDIAVSGLRR